MNRKNAGERIKKIANAYQIIGTAVGIIAAVACLIVWVSNADAYHIEEEIAAAAARSGLGLSIAVAVSSFIIGEMMYGFGIIVKKFEEPEETKEKEEVLPEI